MLIYMAVPVLIIVGLCIFSYMVGRYVRIGRKQEEIKMPEIIKEPEPPKEPDRIPVLEEEIRRLREALEIKNKEKAPEPPKEFDRTPILEEEIKRLKEALEIKNKELEEQTKATELIIQENQKLSARTRQENTDKVDEKTEPVENNTAALSISHSYEDVLKEPQEKAEHKKPEKKAKRKSHQKKKKKK